MVKQPSSVAVGASSSVRLLGFPQNPSATRLDDHPAWDNLEFAMALTRQSVYPLSKTDLFKIKDQPEFWKAIPRDVRQFIDDQVIHKPDDIIGVMPLTLVRVSSAAERAMQVEGVRQEIPARELVQMLLTAAETGNLPGATEQIEPKERTKIMLSLLNYILPAAKSIEVDDRADRSDRKRRTLKDMTKQQISGLSEDELRQLINQSLEEEET